MRPSNRKEVSGRTALETGVVSYDIDLVAAQIRWSEFWQRVLGRQDRRQRVEGARRVTARPHHGAPPLADAGDTPRAHLPVPLAPSTKRAISRTPRSRY